MAVEFEGKGPKRGRFLIDVPGDSGFDAFEFHDMDP
jgi:hypothetical protein